MEDPMASDDLRERYGDFRDCWFILKLDLMLNFAYTNRDLREAIQRRRATLQESLKVSNQCDGQCTLGVISYSVSSD